MNGKIKTKYGLLSVYAGSPRHNRKYTDEELNTFKNILIKNNMKYKKTEQELGMYTGELFYQISTHCPFPKKSNEMDIVPKNFISLELFAELQGITIYGVKSFIYANNIYYILVKNKMYIHIDTKLTNKRLISSYKIDMIIELNEENLKVDEISKRVGIAKATAYTYLKLFTKRNIKKYNYSK